MGVVGPEGLSKHKGFNAVRCLTLPSVRLRHKGLRADCLTFAGVSDYPLSPASTRRRMASERDLMPCFARQVSTRASSSAGHFWPANTQPVSGLPRFFGLTSVDPLMGLWFNRFQQQEQPT